MFLNQSVPILFTHNENLDRFVISYTSIISYILIYLLVNKCAAGQYFLIYYSLFNSYVPYKLIGLCEKECLHKITQKIAKRCEPHRKLNASRALLDSNEKKKGKQHRLSFEVLGSLPVHTRCRRRKVIVRQVIVLNITSKEPSMWTIDLHIYLWISRKSFLPFICGRPNSYNNFLKLRRSWSNDI